MSSTLGCIGLAIDDAASLDALVERLLPDARIVAQSGDLRARRWTDSSGASLTMTVRQAEGDDENGVLVDLVPSYVDSVGAGGVRVATLTGHGQTLAAELVDAAGESVTRIACDLAQSIVTEITAPRDARITALGLQVTVHADAAAFAASDESILGTAEQDETPTRFATESLLAYGLFGDPEAAEPTAFVSGTVLSVATHTNAELEQAFHAARIGTVGGTLTMCLAAHDHPDAPQVGNVLSGVCFLVLDVPDLA